MINYAPNAFVATKISFINEIANVCEETGADVTVVADGMGLDERIGPHFLQPGLGYGGSCFPKDVAALKQLAGNSGYHFELLNAVVEVNGLQKRGVLTKLMWHLGSLRGKRVALLGLAFKPQTNDVREAASLVLASRLIAEGAHVRAWDPVALMEAAPLLDEEVELCSNVMNALDGSDAAVVVTEWPELRQLVFADARRAAREFRGERRHRRPLERPLIMPTHRVVPRSRGTALRPTPAVEVLGAFACGARWAVARLVAEAAVGTTNEPTGRRR